MTIIEIALFDFSVGLWVDPAIHQPGDAIFFADTHSMNYGVDLYAGRLVLSICTPFKRKDR